MFQCLVMYISLYKIYYVYAWARYIYLATILRLSHVCGVRASLSNILSAGGSALVPGHWSAVTRLLVQVKHSAKRGQPRKAFWNEVTSGGVWLLNLTRTAIRSKHHPPNS